MNDDGEMTSDEPFGTFYYAKAPKREEATVFNIGLGDIVENLEIFPPVELKTIAVVGVFALLRRETRRWRVCGFQDRKKKAGRK